MSFFRSYSSPYTLPFLALSLALLPLFGCGNSEAPKTAMAEADYYSVSPKSPTNGFARVAGSEERFGSPTAAPTDAGGSFRYNMEQTRGTEAKTGVPGDGTSAPVGQNIPARKIIQNHNIEVAVEDLEAAEKRLMELVQASGGYISRSEVGSNPGAKRQGSWTLRVPGNKASDIASKIVALGEPMRQSSDARDVSEEFYDLEARIKNKKIEEERLIQHLKDSTGKLIDILAVEKEITRVRGEIEQSQGRLNMLGNLTSLATIQVSLVEHKNYKPEPAPTFWTKAARTFHQSLEGLYEFFANLTLWIISWSPWLVLWALIFGFARVVWLVRKAMKKS